jgi:molybdopterin/thiamine biosynthesis adenylyltransferase
MKFWTGTRNRGDAAATSAKTRKAESHSRALPTVRLTDGLLREFEMRLASRAPERGGVILGTGSLLHTFIEDDHGNYSGGHWDVSDEVVAICNDLQRRRHGLYAGQIHSHPQGVPDPSAPDRTLMMNALASNPLRPYLVVPILTEGVPREYDVAVGPHHRLSMMIAIMSSNGPEMQRAEVAVVPLIRDLVSAGFEPSSGTSTSDTLSDRTGLGREIEIDGKTYIGYVRRGDHQGCLLINPDYPHEPPILLQPSAGSRMSIVGPGVWAPENSSRCLAGLIGTVSGSTVDDQTIAGSTARIEPLVGSLRGAHALIAGLGSVGSRIAEDLCRSGVGIFTLIDPDEVEAPNLGRSVYVAADLGHPKVDALTRRLRAINPGVIVESFPLELGYLDNLADVVAAVDVVVGATDDMEQQELLSHHAYAAHRSMVSCALYRRAAAGEVIFSIPAANTPCIYCSLADLDSSVRAEKDYGTGGRLVAEPALGASIQLVASFASILALSILAGPGTEAGRALLPLIRTGRTYGKISTTPDWDFFPELFNEMGHQHAPQSVWIQSQKRRGCYACGDDRRPPVDRASGAQLAAYLKDERATGT